MSYNYAGEEDDLAADCGPGVRPENPLYAADEGAHHCDVWPDGFPRNPAPVRTPDPWEA